MKVDVGHLFRSLRKIQICLKSEISGTLREDLSVLYRCWQCKFAIKLVSLIWYMIWNHIYLLIAIGLTPGGSSTVHIYAQTIHTTTHSTQQYGEHHN